MPTRPTPTRCVIAALLGADAVGALQATLRAGGERSAEKPTRAMTFALESWLAVASRAEIRRALWHFPWDEGTSEGLPRPTRWRPTLRDVDLESPGSGYLGNVAACARATARAIECADHWVEARRRAQTPAAAAAAEFLVLTCQPAMLPPRLRSSRPASDLDEVFHRRVAEQVAEWHGGDRGQLHGQPSPSVLVLTANAEAAASRQASGRNATRSERLDTDPART